MKRYLFSIVLILFSNGIIGQSGFEKLYNRVNQSGGVCEGANSNYLAVNSISLSNGSNGCEIILFDSTGGIIVLDTIASINSDVFPSLFQSVAYNHGSYWIVGDIGLGGWIMKLDNNLDSLWSKEMLLYDSVITS